MALKTWISRTVTRLPEDPLADARIHVILVAWYVGVALAVGATILLLNLDRLRSFMSTVN